MFCGCKTSPDYLSAQGWVDDVWIVIFRSTGPLDHRPNVASCCFPPGHVIPPEKVHEKLFVGSEREFKKPSRPAVARYNKKHTAEQIAKMKDKLLRKEWKLRKRLAAHGIDYDFPGFVSRCIHLFLFPLKQLYNLHSVL